MLEAKTAEHASESQHWYDPKTGEPRYTYLNAKGEEKPTTLREARKHGWVTSVSTINNLAAKPGLQNWIQDQVLLAALTTPRIMNENEQESEADYIARIKKDSKAQAKAAADRGTAIHAWVQSGFENKPVPPEGMPYYLSAKKTLQEACGDVEWVCEKPFATDKYGGKCDLHCPEYLIDIKGTDKDMSTLKLWEDHWLQLAAYRYGLKIPNAKCFILYVHRDTAETKIIQAEEDKLIKGLKMFQCLLDFYRVKNGLE